MSPWFKRSRAAAPERTGREVENRLRALDERFARIEESLARLSAQSPNITIEQVHIHQPVLERMEYRLDGLDIEHLSGSLNLGNNFGAKMAAASPAPESRKPSPPRGGRAPAKEPGGASPGRNADGRPTGDSRKEAPQQRANRTDEEPDSFLEPTPKGFRHRPEPGSPSP